LASLVLYKVFFGMIHIFKFKLCFNCNRKYKTKKYDLHAEVKRLRQQTQDWNDSVDEDPDMTILEGLGDAELLESMS
jgi:hypothetical protein